MEATRGCSEGGATGEKMAGASHGGGGVGCGGGTKPGAETGGGFILERGPAYNTGGGFTGPADGVIGVNKEQIIRKFVSGLPSQFEPASGRALFNAVMVTIDPKNRKATDIQRIAGFVKL